MTRSSHRRGIWGLGAVLASAAALVVPAAAHAATATDFGAKLHHTGQVKQARLSVFFYPSRQIVMSQLTWSCTSGGKHHRLLAGGDYNFFMHAHLKHGGRFHYALTEHQGDYTPTDEKVIVHGARTGQIASATVDVHTGLPGCDIHHATWRARGQRAGIQG